MRDREKKREYDRLYHAKRKAARQLERKSNPEKYRAAHLKRNFNLSLDEHNAIFYLQGLCCAICGAPTPGCNRNEFCVDHNHNTGEVRGLLCHRCNLGLGHFQDRADLLQAAHSYLLRPSHVHGVPLPL